ncbi:hypothetical protein ACP179_05850 [Xenorhabdus stockiae]|uniref:phage tail fiber protein n=1 Tax=Xenorhabdus stockiae TaxID=351614 RepID=UPI003CEC3004
MIYTQGTLSTVSGSAIVRGTGTKFKDNLSGIAPGQVILIQSGSNNLLHMIQAVNSDTELVLADNVTYQIQTTVPNSISDGVRHMCAINSNIIQFLQNMDQWMTQNGSVEVMLPNGQTVALQSIKALYATMEGKLDKRQVTQVSGNSSEYVMSQDAVTKEFLSKRETTSQSMSSELNVISGISARRPDNSKRIGMYIDSGGGFISLYENGQNSTLQIPTGRGIALSLGANCWHDGNGSIKVASPIIEIFPSGKFTTNDESEGATVSKLSLGYYQVTGVLGYNADGAWGVHGGISSPKNNNGLELIYIDDKVNKDGSITIETFHRQHSHLPERFQNKRIKAIVNGEKVYYQDGEPCDIPEGCRLDVRVQMPANSVWNMKQNEI